MALLFQACSDDDNPSVPVVSPAAQAALMLQYPGAMNIAWSASGPYVVADFELPESGSAATTDVTAWYDNNGNWYMTEIDGSYDTLPQAIQTAFKGSTYGSWRVDDVDIIERPGLETVYVIEADGMLNSTDTNVDLYYAADGTLVKSLINAPADNNYADYIPAKAAAAVTNYIDTNYPDGRILEIVSAGDRTEVQLLDGTVLRKVLFTDSGTWLRTKTAIAVSDVPANILEVLAGSAYNGYLIDKVSYNQTAAGNFYRFDLAEAGGDIKVDITTDGILTQVTFDPENPDIDNAALLNATARKYIDKNYPGAVIIGFDYEQGLLAVDIWQDNAARQVMFDGSNKWVGSQWDIAYGELPQPVLQAFTSSSYADATIQDIEYVQQPDNGDYYRFRLLQGSETVFLRITPQGELL